jgi:mRNA-degrading endonuclease YafQ of YafQ-DinJ toxin-antitoxin module
MTNDELNKVIENLRHCDEHYDCITVYTFDNAIEAIELLRKERDEARREYCEYPMVGTWEDHHATARRRGWDCYKACYKEGETL